MESEEIITRYAPVDVELGVDLWLVEEELIKHGYTRTDLVRAWFEKDYRKWLLETYMRLKGS
jgi:hypothetical protein